MEKIKTANALRYLITCSLFLIFHKNIKSQQITGPSQVFPGVQYVYSRLTLPPDNQYISQYYGNWTCSSSNVTFGNVGDIIYFTVNNSETNCTITLSFIKYQKLAGESYYSQSNFSQNITILPRIILPTIYPGENINLTIQDNCSRSGCNYSWNVSTGGPNVCPTCGPTGTSTQGIYINPYDIPAFVNVNCTMTNCSPALNTALESVSTLVQLHSSTVTGPDHIGCVGSTPAGALVYVASHQPWATYYNWSWPPFMTYVNGQGTDHLTLIDHATGSGVVQLQTSNGSGSPGPILADAVVNYPIEVCCRTQLNITNSVNSPNTDDQQSGINLTASNIINSGANARYHAGTEIRLSDGFWAKQGSYFHGYIANCTGTYYRSSNDSLNNSNDPIVIDNINSLNDLASGTKNEIIQNELNIYPNPTKGEFKLVFDRNSELPVSIRVTDVFGKEIDSLQGVKEYDYNFNLKEYSNGIYFLNVMYTDKTISKKVIKN